MSSGSAAFDSIVGCRQVKIHVILRIASWRTVVVSFSTSETQLATRQRTRLTLTFDAVLAAPAAGEAAAGEADPNSPKGSPAAAGPGLAGSVAGALSSANRSCTMQDYRAQHALHKGPTQCSSARLSIQSNNDYALQRCQQMYEHCTMHSARRNTLTATGSADLTACAGLPPPKLAHELSSAAAGWLPPAPLSAPSKAFQASADALAPESCMRLGSPFVRHLASEAPASFCTIGAQILWQTDEHPEDSMQADARLLLPHRPGRPSDPLPASLARQLPWAPAPSVPAMQRPADADITCEVRLWSTTLGMHIRKL